VLGIQYNLKYINPNEAGTISGKFDYKGKKLGTIRKIYVFAESVINGRALGQYEVVI
jgi:hypothetical protein